MTVITCRSTIASKATLNTPSFRKAVRTNLFSESDVKTYESLIYSDCLEELAELTIEKTVLDEALPPVMVFKSLMEKTFFRANQEKYAEELFQPDIKAVYKAIRHHMANVSSRHDLIYLSGINDYLTSLVNDALYPILKTYPVITNFSEDFNDLLRSMRNACSAVAEDSMIDFINSILKEVSDNFLTVKLLGESDQAAAAEGEEEVQPVKAVIPIPLTLVGLNYMTAELGDDKNIRALLASLADQLDSMIFYATTLDRTIYKVFYTGDDVMVDVLRD